MPRKYAMSLKYDLNNLLLFKRAFLSTDLSYTNASLCFSNIRTLNFYVQTPLKQKNGIILNRIV